MATSVGGLIVDMGLVALPESCDEVFPAKLLPWLMESHLFLNFFHTKHLQATVLFLPIALR